MNTATNQATETRTVTLDNVMTIEEEINDAVKRGAQAFVRYNGTADKWKVIGAETGWLITQHVDTGEIGRFSHGWDREVRIALGLRDPGPDRYAFGETI